MKVRKRRAKERGVHKGGAASNAAINRAAFSYCMFELEDDVLTAIDEYLQSVGWTVASLIFDGFHVEHRHGDTRDPETGLWVQLEAAMRGAEAAVQRKLGYKIALKEKLLFEEEEQEEIVYAEEPDTEEYVDATPR